MHTRRHATFLWLGLLLGGALGGCALPTGLPGLGQASSGTAAVPCSAQVDFVCDVQPIVARHCAGCHAQDGIAPFALETYEEVSLVRARLAEVVEEGIMPPWPPSEERDCPPMQGARRLSPQDINTLVTWARGDAAFGTPGSAPALVAQDAPEQLNLGTPDRTFTVGSDYQPNASLADDYRCFVVDPALTSDTYLHAYEILPGNLQMVHHVLLYMALPRDVEELGRWEAADPQAGFECFGSPAPNIPLTLGGWVPGQRVHPFRPGDGAWMPAGSRLVVQLHYNMSRGPALDETRVDLHFVDGPVRREIGTLPFPITSFSIPAGAQSHTASETLGDIPAIFWSDDLALALEGVAPHMHLLGTSIGVTMEQPGMPDACLVDVPRWDFHWQGFYLFNTPSPLVFPPGSTFRLTCSWDNSPENQPVVDGTPLAPRRVTWGEGTRDEMCLAYLVLSGNPGWVQTLITFFEL